MKRKWLGSRHEIWVWHQDWGLVGAFVLGSVWGHVGHDIPAVHIVEGAIQGGIMSMLAQFAFRAKRVVDVPPTTGLSMPALHTVIAVKVSGHSNN